MTLAAIALEAVLAVLAWVVTATRERSHVYVAALFTWYALGDAAQWWAYEYLRGFERPYAGTAAIVLHVSHWFLFSREFAFVACVLWYFGRICPVMLVPLLIASYAPTLDYPRMSGRVLQVYYVAILTLTQAIAWGLGLSRIVGRARVRPELAHFGLLISGCLSLYLLADMAFVYSWALCLPATVLCTSADVAIHVSRLRRT